MINNNWQDQHVIVLGAARQGLAIARYLANQGAKVTLSDMRPLEDMQEEVKSLSDTSVEFAFGGHPDELLDTATMVCVSGGVPLTIPFVQRAVGFRKSLVNDAQLFMEVVPCRVIGITGSAGKTTTTTLVGRIAQAFAELDGEKAPRKVWVGGNIGNPLISDVENMQKEDVVIMELSSFQLELMTKMPQIAAVLNITPNHLDRHGTMRAYTIAKGNIVYYQNEDDIAILGRDDDGAWDLSQTVAGSLASFGKNKLQENAFGSWIEDDKIFVRDENATYEVMRIEEISLRGDHNIMNVLAATAIATMAGFSVDAIRQGVIGFEGVQHRQQLIREWGGAKWYDDSIATAPERTMAALHSFDEPIVLLLGGRDKKLPWNDLANLIHQKVDHVILFGEMAEMVAEELGEVIEGQKPFSIDVTQDVAEAVECASKLIENGDVVLLSPGGTSYDAYRDFEERGDHFRSLVEKL